MRTVQTMQRTPLLHPHRAEPARRRERNKTTSEITIAYGVAFLAGYLPGILLGGKELSALGGRLANLYAEKTANAVLGAAFVRYFALIFLQLSVVFFCGFCVWGAGLLGLAFAARGMFLGFGAASVALASGAGGLLSYRLQTAAADLTGLFLCLWLARQSATLATALFRTMQGRSCVEREMGGALRRLMTRFVLAVMLSAVAGVFCAVLVVVGNKIGR